MLDGWRGSGLAGQRWRGLVSGRAAWRRMVDNRSMRWTRFAVIVAPGTSVLRSPYIVAVVASHHRIVFVSHCGRRMAERLVVGETSETRAMT